MDGTSNMGEQRLGRLGQAAFEHVVTVDQAVRGVRRWLARVAQRAARRGMQWIYVVEQVTDGIPHVHFLIHGTAGVGVEALKQAWPYGCMCVSTTPDESGHGTW